MPAHQDVLTVKLPWKVVAMISAAAFGPTVGGHYVGKMFDPGPPQAVVSNDKLDLIMSKLGELDTKFAVLLEDRKADSRIISDHSKQIRALELGAARAGASAQQMLNAPP